MQDVHCVANEPEQVEQVEWQDAETQFPLPSIVNPLLQRQVFVLESKKAFDLQVRQLVLSVPPQVAQVLWQVWQLPFESRKKPLLQKHLEFSRNALDLQLMQVDLDAVEQVAQTLSHPWQLPVESICDPSEQVQVAAAEL